VDQYPSDVQQRLIVLQSQIDRLGSELHSWRNSQEPLAPERLEQLTEQCAEILERWTVNDQRHTRALGELEARLNDWGGIEGRLHQDAIQRIRQLERTIEREWDALRAMHDEPVKLLREQAESLGETVTAVAGSALTGFDKAESRFAALESDVHRHMDQVSRDLQAVVAELRAVTGRHADPQGTDVPAWPLEGVLRLHQDLRSTADNGPQSSEAPVDTHTHTPILEHPVQKPTLQLPEAAAALSERVDSLERAVTVGQDELKEAAHRTERVSRRWQVALILLGAGALAASVVAFQLQRQVETSLNEAAARVAAARQEADTAKQLITSVREDAEHRIAQARESASKAATITNVLAAPDLIRANLVGGDPASRIRAQVLWSRSRGLVFSASRVPAAAPNTTYQLWLLTPDQSISAGLFVPDAGGGITLAREELPNVPQPVTGFSVTVEPTGGSPVPSGTVVLARAPERPPT
jgi:anti-sigma-K factor RskA